MYILIVDDDVALGRNLARALRSAFDEEIEVFTAQNGGDALLAIAENPIEDLMMVVTNFGLPGMTGGELAQHVKEQWPEAGPIFILWTKKIVPEVVSDLFRMIREKNPDIEGFARSARTMTAHH
jgi:DNA-binding response OmpR family regulator